ncbi:hypothetical protein [Lacinutrix salivirga]
MNTILKSISFIFHPILIPLLAVLFYFSKSPRFIPVPVIKAKLISLVILTILLPILIFYLLKTLGVAKTIYLKSTKERIIPLVLNVVILLLILFRVFPIMEIPELYYFFLGALCSTIACIVLAFLKFKASLHMVSITGLFMFYFALSLHFSININGTLAMVVLIVGAVATSRLHLKAHTYRELIVGSFIGVFPQLLLFKYWL